MNIRNNVQSFIDRVISPLIERDGGHIELIDVRGTLVQVRLSGACSGCPGKPYTLSKIVEPALKHAFGDEYTLEADGA